MKKRSGSSIISNRRARFDYEIEKTYTAGVSLTGAEAKSLRMHHGILNGAYVQINDDGAWLINMQVNPLVTNVAHLPEADRSRTRRLLLKRKEIDEIRDLKKSGRQAVPLRLFTSGWFIKLEIGVGRGKKRYDKRETIKRRDLERTELSRLKHG